MNKNFHGAQRLLILLLVLVCAACSSDTTPEGGSKASPKPKASKAADSSHQPASTTPASPQEVRLLMEKLLGHHAILMIRLMRGAIDREPEFVQAADDALKRDTDELTKAVGSVYGADKGQAFESLWIEHVDSLKAYSQGRADGDEAAMAEAMRRLDAYSAKYGQAVSQLTGGELPAEAVADSVAAHIHHLVDATDAYADEDYTKAFQGERTAYNAMFATGKAISGAAVSNTAGELPAGFDNPPAQLRSNLGRLLGEHAELAFDATRAVVTGSPAAEAGAGALNANTREIIAAMQGALGAKAAKQFSSIWASHIDALVQFSIAVAEKDAQAQSRARAELDRFPDQLGPALSSMSGGRVVAGTVIDALQHHDEQLLQQVIAYAARDYRTSHELAYAGYDHMFAIADVLANALEGRTTKRSPVGGAATGGGGLTLR